MALSDNGPHREAKRNLTKLQNYIEDALIAADSPAYAVHHLLQIIDDIVQLAQETREKIT